MAIASVVPPARRRRSFWWWVLIAALLVLMAAAVVLLSKRTGTSSTAMQRIAVLPFTNISNDPEQEYLADGMTEQLITEMAHISAWQVISRTSVMRYKGTTLALPELATDLGADQVIEGTVQRSSGRVRITAQLIDARTDVHLWSGTFEKDMSNVLELQSEIARTIASELHVKLSESENARLKKAAGKVVPEAYDAYLTGQYFLNRNRFEAATFYRQAMHLDPNFAPAYAYFFEANGRIYFADDTPFDQRDMAAFEAGKESLGTRPKSC